MGKSNQQNPQRAIPHLLTLRRKDNNFENFPHYSTTGPNEEKIAGIETPMPFQLTPEQIQMIANMTAYTVTGGKGLQALTQIHTGAKAALEY